MAKGARTVEVESLSAPALPVKSTESDAMLARLTPMQAAFCKEYAVTGNGTQSAKNAGYSADNAAAIASKILKQPNVRAAIERLRFEQTADLDITDATVLDGLLAEATWKGKGSSHAARVSAWKELADIKGLHKTPDIGAWQGISTIRLEIVGPDGTRGTLELGPGKK